MTLNDAITLIKNQKNFFENVTDKIKNVFKKKL